MSHSTFSLDCWNTILLTAVMLSALSQSILAKVVFLISCSIASLYAVRLVFKFSFGAFSCQKRSPTLRRLNCSATMHWKVGPSTPPSLPLGLGSSIPLKKKPKPVFGYKFYQSHYKTRKICIAGTERNRNYRGLFIWWTTIGACVFLTSYI